MKKIEAVDCSGICSPFEVPPCGSLQCRCVPAVLVAGYCIHPTGLSSYMAKMIDEHPNICQSDEECIKKGRMHEERKWKLLCSLSQSPYGNSYV